MKCLSLPVQFEWLQHHRAFLWEPGINCLSFFLVSHFASSFYVMRTGEVASSASIWAQRRVLLLQETSVGAGGLAPSQGIPVAQCHQLWTAENLLEA